MLVQKLDSLPFPPMCTSKETIPYSMQKTSTIGWLGLEIFYVVDGPGSYPDQIRFLLFMASFAHYLFSD